MGIFDSSYLCQWLLDILSTSTAYSIPYFFLYLVHFFYNKRQSKKIYSCTRQMINRTGFDCHRE